MSTFTKPEVYVFDNAQIQNLPALPEIDDHDLYNKVFCLDNREDISQPDNVRCLESYGDAVLNMIVSNYINKKLPNVHGNVIQYIESFMISNAQWTQYADACGLPAKLFPPEKKEDFLSGKKPKADLFEAFAGALYIEGREDELTTWFEAIIEMPMYAYLRHYRKLEIETEGRISRRIIGPSDHMTCEIPNDPSRDIPETDSVKKEEVENDGKNTDATTDS